MAKLYRFMVLITEMIAWVKKSKPCDMIENQDVQTLYINQACKVKKKEQYKLFLTKSQLWNSQLMVRPKVRAHLVVTILMSLYYHHPHPFIPSPASGRGRFPYGLQLPLAHVWERGSGGWGNVQIDSNRNNGQRTFDRSVITVRGNDSNIQYLTPQIVCLIFHPLFFQRGKKSFQKNNAWIIRGSHGSRR